MLQAGGICQTPSCCSVLHNYCVCLVKTEMTMCLQQAAQDLWWLLAHSSLCALVFLSRQQSGFVGLKNGGATCYMNAVFQQLFMQPSIRALVLGRQGGSSRGSQKTLSFSTCRCVLAVQLM